MQFPVEVQRKTLFKFSPGVDLSCWTVVNDGVMGGKSEGHLELTEEGFGKFFGNVSLENFGGFTSIKCELPYTLVNDNPQLAIRVKGDGTSYQFRIKHSPDDMLSYGNMFRTSSEWRTIYISLAALVPQWRGKSIKLPRFHHEGLSEFTILIANRKNESFELLIDKIELLSYI